MTHRPNLARALALAVLTISALAVPAQAKPPLEDRLEKVAREEINALRADNGLRPVRRSRGLARSASRYAQFLLRRNFFGHLSSIRAPRHFRPLGEILLMHSGAHGRPRRTVKLWAGSAGHRSVLLKPGSRQIGIGRASGRFGGRPVTIWVGHVGRR